MDRPSHLGRRSALKTLAAAFLAACDTTIRRLQGFKVAPIATLDQVPPGGAYRTKFRDEPIILVNVAGDVRAFVAVCTHEGCPLGWNPNQHLIRCPCHGSAFDTRGFPVNGPATISLPAFETIVHGNQISLVYMPNDQSKVELKSVSH
jgi:Rieske Fe-S protein